MSPLLKIATIETLYYDRIYALHGLSLEVKEKEIFDNSIIIITADHGEEFYDHRDFQHGKTLYDESTHIPLIIIAPGIAHEVISKQANQIDIMPTILAL